MDGTGLDNIGKPIDHLHREAGNDMLKNHIGVKGSADRFTCIQAVAESLEKDRPHEAMKKAEEYMDPTSAYMLFAALLAPIVKKRGE